MGYIHISSDPTNKMGYIVFSDDGEYSPIGNMPCYEVINLNKYENLDMLSWYLYQNYKGYSWKIDYFL